MLRRRRFPFRKVKRMVRRGWLATQKVDRDTLPAENSLTLLRWSLTWRVAPTSLCDAGELGNPFAEIHLLHYANISRNSRIVGLAQTFQFRSARRRRIECSHRRPRRHAPATAGKAPTVTTSHPLRLPERSTATTEYFPGSSAVGPASMNSVATVDPIRTPLWKTQ